MDLRDEHFRQVVEALEDGVYVVDGERRIAFWNTAAERITGFTFPEVSGHCCYDNILKHVDAKGKPLCFGGCPVHATLDDGARREALVYLHHKDGHRVPVTVRTAPIVDAAGAVVGVVEVFRDSSERLSALERLSELERQSYIDELTGVANRRFLKVHLEQRMSEFERGGWPFGLAMLDVDGFKRFNDTYGHEIGDRVLAIVAKTLAGNLRGEDLVGRWGEEFLVVLHRIERTALHSVADRLRRLISRSGLREDEKVHHVTASFGATMVRTGDTIDGVIARADALMYESKSGGRNRTTTDSNPPPKHASPPATSAEPTPDPTDSQ